MQVHMGYAVTCIAPPGLLERGGKGARAAPGGGGTIGMAVAWSQVAPAGYLRVPVPHVASVDSSPCPKGRTPPLCVPTRGERRECGAGGWAGGQVCGRGGGVHMVTCGAPLGCYAGAHGAAGHLPCSLKAPCKHMGHLVTCGAPQGCHVGAHGALGHVPCTFRALCTMCAWRPKGAPHVTRVPCTCTWGIWSPVVHPQGAMQAHMGHLVTCDAPPRCHARAHGAFGHLRCTRRVPCTCTWVSRWLMAHP